MEELQVGDRVQCISHEDNWVKEAGCKIGEWYTVVDSGAISITVDLNSWKSGLMLDPKCFRKEDPFIINFEQIIADGDN